MSAAQGHPGSEASVLLSVESLSAEFVTRDGIVRAVDDVSFAVAKGETVAMVGESGSGKSVTALTLMRLFEPSARPRTTGRARFWTRHGEVDLLAMQEAKLRKLCGSEVAMIFQDPTASLDPLFSVGSQLAETVRQLDPSERLSWQRAVQLLKTVGIPAADVRAHDFPHQLSGGMRQRVMIAMAIAGNPRLLIADEPTTALDVTIQAQILDLLRALQKEHELGILFITHDLGIVSELAHRVVVLYAGQVVETGPTSEVLTRPHHPYTAALLASIPGRRRVGTYRKALIGSGPATNAGSTGCSFRARCPYAQPECAQRILLTARGDSRQSRCLLSALPA